MTRQTMVPDWGLVIEQLGGAGCGNTAIGRAMGMQVTDRMIRYYRDGMQPAWWRGQMLLELWAERLGRSISDVPMTELRRGYRAMRSHAPDGPRVQALPNWPPTAPVAVAPVKRRKRTQEAA